jgi:hypothetical protein
MLVFAGKANCAVAYHQTHGAAVTGDDIKSQASSEASTPSSTGSTGASVASTTPLSPAPDAAPAIAVPLFHTKFNEGVASLTLPR